MVQDFAKIRPEPILDKRAMQAPPAWSLLLTGLLTGVAVGVFGCFLLYLSGNIPPLPGQPLVIDSPPVTEPPPTVNVTGTITEPAVDEEVTGLTLEFYEELLNYEVIVDATPIQMQMQAAPSTAITSDSTEATEGAAALPSVTYMLQAGAFEQAAGADRRQAVLEELGLNTVIKRQDVPGRTLHLVQAGPFHSNEQLTSATALLRRNNIPSITIRLN